MHAVALALLVLLAPEPVTLRYRFEKGLVYRESIQRSAELDLLAGGKKVRSHTTSDWRLKRTVISVDREGRVTRERIEVLNATRNFIASPDKPEGVKQDPFHGRRFVWRDGALHDDSGNVSSKYPRLVQHLGNWRDARLPGKPVAPGATWEVTAKKFLEAVGQTPPKDVAGRARFRLASVEGGVARIEIDFSMTYKSGPSTLGANQTGVWLFDVAKGRDLSLELSGKVEIDNGRGGSGKIATVRKLTFPGRESSR